MCHTQNTTPVSYMHLCLPNASPIGTTPHQRHTNMNSSRKVSALDDGGGGQVPDTKERSG